MDKFVFTIEEGMSLEKAIEFLDKNHNGMLPVIQKDGTLYGLITDGDIRKAIINNELSLEKIINKNPYKLNISSTNAQRIQFLRQIKRRHLPLVDDNNVFISVFTLDELYFNLKPNWVVIMAGGLGTRLGELTKETPKPMLKIRNKPIIEHIIDMFVSYGFTKFMLSVNYKADVIKNYFKDGRDFGVEIQYIEENKRLGTAGALSLIENKMEEPFFVINGDIMTSLNFEQLLEFHNSIKSDATMCVRSYDYQIPYGVITTDSKKNILAINEKPIYEFLVNAGVYVVNPIILDYIPKDDYFDMPNLFDILKKDQKNIKAYEINDYWIDIGHPEDFEKVQKDSNVRY